MASWGKMKFIISLPSLSLVKYLAEGTNRCESGVNTSTGDTHTRLPLLEGPWSGTPKLSGGDGAAWDCSAAGRDEFTQNTRQRKYR